MVFGILPGICLIAYTFECGYENKPFIKREFFAVWQDIEKAKRKAIKQTGALLFPWRPALGGIVIGGILFVILTDSLMLIIMNLTAIPAGILSYQQGKKCHKIKGIISFKRGAQELDEILLPYKAVFPYAIRIILFWISLSATLMTIAYFLKILKPHGHDRLTLL